MSTKEFCNLIDSKLAITTHDGNFEGILKFVLIKEERATFEHVFELPSREYLGTMHILLSSISSWRLLNPAEQILDASKFDPSEELFRDLFDKSKRIDKAELIEDASGSHFIEYLPWRLKAKCPRNYVIIDSMSPVFFNAVEQLSEASILGASFHGPKISRSGNLSWMCISSAKSVFLFDIDKLGKPAFEKGLKRIFENDEIKKVIHDCREASDCLLHMFNTELNNVFDTQVADYLINMQMYTGKEVFKYVVSLHSCLFKYLGVPQQFLYNHNKSILIDKEREFFQKRPISEDFIKTLVTSSIYLLLLKEKQEKFLMSTVERASELYLNSVRTASDAEVHMASSEFSEFAPSCLLENVKCVRFFDCPQPPDDVVNLFKGTPHGQKTWQNWKKNDQEDSESDTN